MTAPPTKKQRMIGPKISKKDVVKNEDVEEEVNPVLGEVPVPSTANTEEKRRKSIKGLKKVFEQREHAEEEEQPVLQDVPSPSNVTIEENTLPSKIPARKFDLPFVVALWPESGGEFEKFLLAFAAQYLAALPFDKAIPEGMIFFIASKSAAALVICQESGMFNSIQPAVFSLLLLGLIDHCDEGALDQNWIIKAASEKKLMVLSNKFDEEFFLKCFRAFDNPSPLIKHARVFFGDQLDYNAILVYLMGEDQVDFHTILRFLKKVLKGSVEWSLNHLQLICNYLFANFDNPQDEHALELGNLYVKNIGGITLGCTVKNVKEYWEFVQFRKSVKHGVQFNGKSYDLGDLCTGNENSADIVLGLVSQATMLVNNITLNCAGTVDEVKMAFMHILQNYLSVKAFLEENKQHLAIFADYNNQISKVIASVQQKYADSKSWITEVTQIPRKLNSQ